MRATIQHVSDTAIWVAFCRAKETARPDALISDPLAASLVGERGGEIAEQMADLAEPMERWMGVRTAVLDDMLSRALRELRCDAVLNLAAGLDTRPYRMPLPRALRWFEADFPRLIEHKEAVLAGERSTCLLERRALDLEDARQRAALLDEVASVGKRILVVSEGLLMYWDPRTVAELATDLASRPAYVGWLLDLVSAFALAHLRQDFRSNFGPVRAKLRFAPDAGSTFFADYGWSPREERLASAEAALLLKKSERELAGEWQAFYGTEDPEQFRESYRFVLMERRRRRAAGE